MTNKVNANTNKRSSKQNPRRANSRVAKTKNSNGYSAFWDSSLAKFLKVVLIIIAIVLFDLLISRNDFSKFYLFLGIELILAFIFVVFRLIIQQNKLDK